MAIAPYLSPRRRSPVCAQYALWCHHIAQVFHLRAANGIENQAETLFSGNRLQQEIAEAYGAGAGECGVHLDIEGDGTVHADPMLLRNAEVLSKSSHASAVRVQDDAVVPH